MAIDTTTHASTCDRRVRAARVLDDHEAGMALIPVDPKWGVTAGATLVRGPIPTMWCKIRAT